jgi:hypothetical protein
MVTPKETPVQFTLDMVRATQAGRNLTVGVGGRCTKRTPQECGLNPGQAQSTLLYPVHSESRGTDFGCKRYGLRDMSTITAALLRYTPAPRFGTRATSKVTP